MRNSSVLFLSLLMLGCSAVERIQSKTEMALQPQPQDGLTPRKEAIEYAKRRDVLDLEKVVKQQNIEISQLRQELSQAKLQNEEFRNMMLKNFTLLERAVAEQQTQSMQIEPIQTEPQHQETPQEELIEKYSLFDQKPNALDVTPVPLPPPDERKVVRETPQSIKKSPIIAPVKKQTKSYQDPDLNEPKRPYTLKSYPPVKKMYDQGMQALFQNQPQKAIQLLAAVVQDYPDDEYGDNAMFWLGNTYFKMKKLDLAEKQFRGVLKNYEHRPTSQGYKTPDAIQMLGQIYAMKNEREKAKYYFRAVMERFPGSTAAMTAKQDLTRLK